MAKPSETTTEAIFRKRYGQDFIEKSAILPHYGFQSKRHTAYAGYPDFFRATPDLVIVVEAKALKHSEAESDVRLYMENNAIQTDIVGMAVSGQAETQLKVTYFYKLAASTAIEQFEVKDKLLRLNEIERALDLHKRGEMLTDEQLIAVLRDLNKRFHKGNKVRDTDRSLFFSGIMIALTDDNFRTTYRGIQMPSAVAKSTTQATVLQAHNLNKAILDAITAQLTARINNLSKEFSWRDKFSFIKNVDYPLEDYRQIISDIEEKIFRPYQAEEKQDILGKAYKIFLSRAGKIDNKNIILTPDHIKSLMVKLSRLTADDIVLDTCTGSGGFLMEAMEVMMRLAWDDTAKLDHIKEEQLIGFEVDSVLFALASTNMYLHGDGRSNLLYRSSLLHREQGVLTNQDDILFNYIREQKPTKCIINPPYESDLPIAFTKQALDYLEPNGRLIIIMPTPTLTKYQAPGGLTEDILAMAKLDFIISMPDNIFSEQGRGVRTSIFGFTKTPHHESDAVLFYNLDDDGLESVQHKGRIDTKNLWADIEGDLLDAVSNGTEVPSISSKRRVIRNGVINAAGFAPEGASERTKKVSDLFKVSKGTLQSSKGDDTGEYTFITAADGWKRHSAYEHDGEALVYAVGASGSLGRCHYVKGRFIASNLCLVLKKRPDGPDVNFEFYQRYFEAKRKQIVSDLANGASKLTIRQDRFENYDIEIFDREAQDAFICNYAAVEALQQELADTTARLRADIEGAVTNCWQELEDHRE